VAGIGLRHVAEEQPRVHIRAFTEEVPITHAYALDGADMNASALGYRGVPRFLQPRFLLARLFQQSVSP